MAQTIGRLTASSLRALPAGLHADGGNLMLQVTASGARTWIFRYRLQGRRRDMGLGALHTVGLADARKLAKDARSLLLSGVCPLGARQQALASTRAKASHTFARLADDYITAHKAGWSQKSLDAWRMTLTEYAYPVLGALPVSEVDTAAVMRVLSPLWQTRTETAVRLRGRIEAVLDAATVQGHRRGDNPARWRGHLEQLLVRPAKIAKVEHLSALPWPEMSAFMAALRSREGVAARALEFAILCASRSGDVRGMRWDEVVDGVWVVPAARMKAGKEHRVPLSDVALALLAKMPKVDALVFPGVRSGGAFKPLSDMSLLAVLKRMGRRDITVHGFRSTFRDWASERTNFPRELAELALAHAVGGKVERAYARSDQLSQRRRLMSAWAEFCAAPAMTAASVLPLSPRRV